MAGGHIFFPPQLGSRDSFLVVKALPISIQKHSIATESLAVMADPQADNTLSSLIILADLLRCTKIQILVDLRCSHSYS
jgi:hypothetical protein